MYYFPSKMPYSPQLLKVDRTGLHRRIISSGRCAREILKVLKALSKPSRSGPSDFSVGR